MKVLFLVNCSAFFCSHFLQLATAVKGNGHEVIVASGNGIKKNKIEELGFIFYEIKLSRSGKNPMHEVISIISIYKALRFFQPDLLHMFTIKPILYGSLINRFFPSIINNVTIASVTGLGSSSLSSGFLNKLLWWTLQKIYKYSLNSKNVKVIFENEDDNNFFIQSKIIPENKAYIVNGAGVDIQEFSPSSEKFIQITVILVARLLKDKGVLEYIEAGKILKQRMVNVRLLLVGSTDESNPSSLTEHEVSSAHASGYVERLGYRTDIAELYKKSHIACLPSYREGLPKSLIEAASCGLPIVTTDVPGCRQMVEDGINGFLVPARDSHSLANALHKLVENKELLESMGVYNRQISEARYSNERIIASFFHVYGFQLTGEVSV
ncbi:glycosyltransferase family 1 protein [Pseudoalteromonas sp. S201]|uniref:glycosyltransferase family 4 protein n=1 Tax=Pseudoalteromonas sp. S201 TaxID=579519 RepID=UPI00110D0F11|nr:glycosyltransferase family 4 protein [Pseudoalteromonas sp. S201]TMS92553.1 glycosyltransferase family 1 protein [Pseudoalteromonas sp. S201]